MKRRELVFEGDRWVTAVAAVGDGFAVGIGGGRPRVVLLDGALTPLDELTVPAEVRSLAASPSAKALAIGTTTGRYTLVEFAGRTSSSSFEIPSLSWVEDARGALWRSEDALVAIRGELIAERLADGRLREFERKGATELLHLSLCADGSRAATGDSSKALRVWDVAKGKQLRKLNARQFARSAFSPDGAVLA